MSEIISFKPGQILAIEVGSVAGKPSYVEYDHTELLKVLVGHSHQASKRSKTPEAKASRQVCLMVRAIRTGKWSTGALIDKMTVTNKLYDLMSKLSPTQKEALSLKAKAELQTLGLHYSGSTHA